MHTQTNTQLPSNKRAAEVTLEDQQRINTFARLHMVYREVKTEQEEVQKRMDELDSASVQIMDVGDGALTFIGRGSAYFPVDCLDIDSLIDGISAGVREKLAALRQRAERIAAEMDSLKAHLERKFADTINLNYEK